MTCQELRERLVDPASGAQGGHSAVVDHLHTCADCRALSRAFGGLERLFSKDLAGDPPPDFDRRVRDRLALKQARGRSGSAVPRGILGVLSLLAVVAALIGYGLYRVSKARPAKSTASKTEAPIAPSRPSGESAQTASFEPVTSLGPTLSDEERNLVASLYDLAFLRNLDVLEGLDPFFAIDVRAEDYGPVIARPTAVPKRPAETPEAQVERILQWQYLPVAERKRLTDQNAQLLARPELQRDRILERWELIRALKSDDLPGLRRLASRFQEMAGTLPLLRLKAQIREVSSLPRRDRPAAFRNLVFVRTLTGQEVQSAERLLALRP